MRAQELLGLLESSGVAVQAIRDADHPILLTPLERIPADLMPIVAASKHQLAALLRRREEAELPRYGYCPSTREDSRPDLPRSAEWVRLLSLAASDAEDPSGLYGRLVTFRACGGYLDFRGGRWRLVATIDPTLRSSTWASEAEWKADRDRWLLPYEGEIAELLLQIDSAAMHV